MGTGSHLHAIIKSWTGQDYTPQCRCKQLVKEMDSHPPEWSEQNFNRILRQMRSEAGRRSWWAKIALAVPGVQAPIKLMIRTAIQRSKDDLAGSGQ